jgi:TPR repeat protein
MRLISALIIVVLASFQALAAAALSETELRLELAKRELEQGRCEKALAIWEELAGDGIAEAQLYLGTVRYTGECGGRDFTEALIWLSAAADQGNPHAYINLGAMYYRGEGVERNRPEAARLYTIAAKKGLPAAQNALAGMYWKGEGVEQDRSLAIVYWRKAAEQGFPPAQYALGRAIYKDDPEAGRRWLERAAAAGHEQSREMLKRLTPS